MLKRNEPIYKQIAVHFQERIDRGELQPGDMIPATFELAKQFEVANQTAQNALQELSRRGLVTRIPRKGTFVSEHLKAETIAIVCGRSLLTEPDTRVYAQISWNVARLLSERGYSSKVYTPSQPEEERSMIDDLERDIRGGLIRAVTVVNVSSQLAPWLEKDCEVPHCKLLSGTDFTLRLLKSLETGLCYLRDRGFQRIGIVVSRFVNSLPEQVAAEAERLRRHDHTLPEINLLTPDNNFPEAGMATILAMDVGPGRPDALFVLDDNVCRGVVVGILAKGLRIPDDIGLLSMANKDLPILSPIPLTRIELDVVSIARRQAAAMLDLLEGKNTPKHSNPTQYLTLKGGLSCRE